MEPPGIVPLGVAGNDVGLQASPFVEPPQYWGDIKFTENFAARRSAPFIVVPGGDNDAVATAIALAKKSRPKGWGLPKPSLIMSVTGGSKDFNVNPLLEAIFSKGLATAAKNASAWIVTGGADAGVMSYVGKAFRHMQSSGNTVPLIGIAPFRAVLHYHELMSKGTDQPMWYWRGHQRGNANEFDALEPHHTHFVFVDAQQPQAGGEWGTCVLGTETELRTQFEGLRAGTKVIIVEESGGAADVIPLWKRKRDRERYQGVGGLGRPCTAKFPFTESEQKQLDAFASKKADLDEICALWDLVYVFNMHKQESFETFLYDVILNSDESFSHKVLLATEWKSEASLQKVFQCHLSEVQAHEDQIADIVLPALVKSLLLNAPEVLSILMEYGRISKLDMRHVVLAVVCCSPPAEPAAAVAENEKLAKILKVACAIAPEMFQRPASDPGAANSQGDGSDSAPSAAPKGSTSLPKSTDTLILPKPGETEVIDVILWALLNQYTNLALRLWRYAEVPIHCALYANKICKALCTHHREAAVLAAYEQAAQEFEDMAVQVLDAYDVDSEAIMALRYQWLRLSKPQTDPKTKGASSPDTPDNDSYLGDLTASATYLAMSIYSKSFMSSRTFQISLRQMWFSYNGYKLPDDFTDWQVIWWLFLPGWNVRHLEFEDPHALGLPPEDIPQKVDVTWESWTAFYKIPRAKFWIRTLLWLCFTALLVYLAMTARRPEDNWQDWVLLFWVTTLYLDAALKTAGGVLQKIGRLKKNAFVFLDIVNIFITVCWFFLRSCYCWAIGPQSGLCSAAQEILSLGIVMSFLRLLSTFSINKKLGTLLTAIGKMLKDIISFFYLLAIVLVCFTVVFAVITRERLRQDAESTLHQFDGDEWHKAYPKGTADLSFWCIVGEFGDSFEFMKGTILGSVILGTYVLVSQVLMVNLLIAMMADTYSEVRENADCEWNLTQFSVVSEYAMAPNLPPPFTFLYLAKGCWMVLRGFTRIMDNSKPVNIKPAPTGPNPETPVTSRCGKSDRRALLAYASSRGPRGGPSYSSTLKSLRFLINADICERMRDHQHKVLETLGKAEQGATLSKVNELS
eukprot:jgi/Mesvir1/18455/Mv14310-RA.1